MTIETARAIFDVAFEAANPDENGRREAAKALLNDVLEAAGQANLAATRDDDRTIRLGLIRQVRPTFSIWVENITIKWGDGKIDGVVDCLTYDPRTKTFSGIWDDEPVDGVERLARFIVEKLKPPKR